MMVTVPHFTSGSGLRKFQADGFFWTEYTFLGNENYPYFMKTGGLFPPLQKSTTGKYPETHE